ncbi:uncharacterized protein LOC105158828 [Sesamum indicum]|uniref:Uncharacterized protein LOC105158828 n=1 Tax=Sesamum indicum TaxID=4182 RepID=A0A6I9SUX4_SESIN|nr:uncharacterized protein LOC105158828 [Sesamum indicum]
MEKGAKRKKQRDEKRSPLQDLNGLPIHKSNSSNPSVSVEAPKGCLRSLLSSNSCSSSSSSASGAHLGKKPRTFSKIKSYAAKKSAADTSKLLPRSKENEVPRRQSWQKSNRNQPQTGSQRRFWRSNARPVHENGQRSKLSSVHGNPENKLSKGSGEFQAKMKKSQEKGPGKLPFELLGVANCSNLNSAEDCTPVGKVLGLDSDSISFADHETVIEDSVYDRGGGNCATAVKTPPVEASLSPEIQCQSRSKVLVFKSAATPVCYGAGHLVSGVTDKRKCRRRGSLKGGCQKINLSVEKSKEEVVNDLQESPIPLLAEASVRWLLSPCDEDRENEGSDSRNSLHQCRTMYDDASGRLNLLASSSMLCENASDLLCADSSCDDSGSTDNMANKRRNRNFILSPIKDSEFQGVLQPSNDKVDELLLAISPSSSYSCHGISSREGKSSSDNVIGENSALCIDSLSSGNVIQTPNSDSSSGARVGGSRSEVFHRNLVLSELDSMTDALNRMELSPRSEMSTWEAPCLGLHFADMAAPPSSIELSQLPEDVDSASSWMFNSTVDNMTVSQMRISWRDGLVSRIQETDEFDWCCLSDEDVDADGCLGEQVTLHQPIESGEGKESYQSSNCGGKSYPEAKSGEDQENDPGLDIDIFPVLSEYEPCISARGKKRLSSHRPNICAESICTDGGGLVASGDSDWTYCRENHLFQVK